jgi:hypothetical protein
MLEMNYQIYTKEKNMPHQTFLYKDIEINNIEEYGTILADDCSSIGFYEEQRAAKGIIYGFLFCIPFWFFL